MDEHTQQQKQLISLWRAAEMFREIREGSDVWEERVQAEYCMFDILDKLGPSPPIIVAGVIDAFDSPPSP